MGRDFEREFEIYIEQAGIAYPASVDEANALVEHFFPGAGMKVNWKRHRFGPYRWHGEIICPLITEKTVACCDTDGYDVAACLWGFFFGKKYSVRGLAGDVYGQPKNLPEAYWRVVG